MRKKRLLVWLGIAGIAAAAAGLAPSGHVPQTDIALPATPKTIAPITIQASLPEREPLGKPSGEIFAGRSWEAKPAAPAATVAAAKAAAAPPGPPPMPYRVAGRLVNADGAHVVLARGGAVLPVSEGDTLDGGYRVESVSHERVTLVYLPLGVREDLPVNATLALDAPPARTALASLTKSAVAADGRSAQFRWEGPRQVRAGDTFEVSLKVTSAQPLRASPLQLSFDAKLLKPVGVRAGGFFAEGMFSYRVNPAGSIFVGAAGKGAVAADAEIVVITFEPVRSGAIAELKISSLVLHGVAGSAIAHERPAAFRTSIVQ